MDGIAGAALDLLADFALEELAFFADADRVELVFFAAVALAELALRLVGALREGWAAISSHRHCGR